MKDFKKINKSPYYAFGIFICLYDQCIIGLQNWKQIFFTFCYLFRHIFPKTGLASHSLYSLNWPQIAVLLPEPHAYWEYRRVPPYPSLKTIFMNLF
jgi:hypothetical protein